MRGGLAHQAPSSRRKPGSRATWADSPLWPEIPAFARMTRFLVVLIITLFCCTPVAVLAAAKNATVERIVAVTPDGTLQLSQTGQAVLADILSPNPDRIGGWLAEYSLQKEFPFTANGEDRYGRTLVESTLQADLLNDGAAVYYATAGKIPDEWRAAETRARTAKHGLWDDRAETVLIGVADTEKAIGKFKVVEGAITRIYSAKSATYLNFGEDWHSDFSVTIPAKNRRSFTALLDTLKPGDRIRVRGVLYQENGPMITVMRPDNLEKL